MAYAMKTVSSIFLDNYYLFSGDTAWLQNVWSNYTKAVAFLEGKVDSTGLMNVTGLRDWARLGGGGYNVEGNAILYKVFLPLVIHRLCIIHASVGPHNSDGPGEILEPNISF